MDHTTQHPQSTIVIIGSGLAGFTVIREIRKLDKAVAITLITREPGYFYSKPMLSTALASKKDIEQLISTAQEGMAAQLDITILSETEVSSINTDLQIVSTSKGTIPFGKLVLALGADQIRLPLEGTAASEVLTVKTMPSFVKQLLAKRK